MREEGKIWKPSKQFWMGAYNFVPVRSIFNNMKYTEKKDMEISLLNLENFDSFSKIRNFPISKFSTSRFQFSEESFQISEKVEFSFLLFPNLERT